MPSITIDFDAPTPVPGSQVLLYGFSQHDQVVFKSRHAFRIPVHRSGVSRRVGEFLQPEMGAYPATPGGPITDSGGNLLGILMDVEVLGQQSEIPAYAI